MADLILNEGSNFYNAQTGNYEGKVEYDAKTGAKLGTGQTTTLSPSPVINGASLGAPSVNMPAPNNSNNAQNMLGVGVNTAINDAANNAAAQATTPSTTPTNTTTSTSTTPAKSAGQTLLDQIYGLIGVDATKGDVTNDLNQEQDIEGKTNAVNDINNQILTTGKAYDDKITEAQKNTEGKFAGGVETDVAMLQRQKNADLANLSIIKSTALGDLSTAQSLVDAKVKAQFEPVEQQISLLTQFYQLNPELGEKDKLTLENEINSQTENTSLLQGAYADVLKTAASNGAPASVLNAIDAAVNDPNATPASIYAAAGSYYQGNSASGSGSSNTATFTTTQLNSGAATAGIPIADFNSLDADVQNYFINSGTDATNFLEAVNAVRSGDLNADDLKKLINPSLPQSVQDYLGGLVDQASGGGSSGSSGGTSFWDWLKTDGINYLPFT